MSNTYDNRRARFAGGPKTASKKKAHIERAAAARLVLPGFPIETAFENPQDVWDYLGADVITCLRCGKPYKSLGHHLWVHGWTVDQYKEFYGLPWKKGLTCVSTKAKHKAAGLANVAAGVAFGGEGGISNPETMAKAMAAPHRKRAPYRRAVCVMNVRNAPSMDKKRVAAGEFLIWKEPDYWRALDRMKEQDRAAVDVCNDEDLPGISALQAFKRSNPKFARAYEAAWESLSLEVQTASTRLGKKFKKQAARMRRAGNTNGEIAKELGVTQLTVHRHLVGVPFPERTHCNKGHLYPLDQKGRKHCQICNTEWKRRHNGSVSRAEAKKMKVTISCFKCGTPVEASYLAKNRRVQCKGCFREYHRVYEANRIRDNA